MKKRYPWYDSCWLSSYVQTKQFLKGQYPKQYQDFIELLSPLQTSPNFSTLKLDQVFKPLVMAQIKDLIQDLRKEELEKHEFFDFGRFIVHDHPYFIKLQHEINDFVGEAVGEAIEPQYNFLSLYNNFGVCAVHMDAPLAKWTLDVCIEQSEPWPIHFSQVLPWPESFEATGRDWETQIKNNPEHHFNAYTLNKGEAIIFSGSSQWHYRDRILKNAKDSFCHLIFFHFIPAGTSEIVDPKNWSRLLGVPELNQIVEQMGSSIRYELTPG